MARFRLWALLAVAGAALPAAAEPPRDSLHTGDAEVWQVPDPAGLSALLDHRRRTPSGLLYPYPWKPYELSDLGDGWRGRGSIETGWFWDTGDTEETRFTRYVERKDGPLLDLLDLELWKPETGDYLMLRAGSRRPPRPVLRPRGRPRRLAALPRLVQRRAPQLREGRDLALQRQPRQRPHRAGQPDPGREHAGPDRRRVRRPRQGHRRRAAQPHPAAAQAARAAGARAGRAVRARGPARRHPVRRRLRVPRLQQLDQPEPRVHLSRRRPDPDRERAARVRRRARAGEPGLERLVLPRPRVVDHARAAVRLVRADPDHRRAAPEPARQRLEQRARGRRGEHAAALAAHQRVLVDAQHAERPAAAADDPERHARHHRTSRTGTRRRRSRSRPPTRGSTRPWSTSTST